MQVYNEELSPVTRCIEKDKDKTLDDYEQQFEVIRKHVERYRHLDANTRILDIGCGTGWFPLLCEMKGLHCEGIEISPQLVGFSRKLGNQYGLQPDIRVGNIEEASIGISTYDVIVASNVFEHVQDWKTGIQKAFFALRPGGVFYFESTNKFSFTSGEFYMPFYGWLPDRFRWLLRTLVHGKDIMKLGIDFNQFTYFGLRRFFAQLGFKHIDDFLSFSDLHDIHSPKDVLVNIARNSRVIGDLALLFAPWTIFVCIK
jgi:SAM-dependent methyltransferase